MILNIAIYMDTVPWPLYYLYIQRMNFDFLGTRNSYPQVEVNHDVKWRYLNHAFSYDAILVPSDYNLQGHSSMTAIYLHVTEWTLIWWVFNQFDLRYFTKQSSLNNIVLWYDALVAACDKEVQQTHPFNLILAIALNRAHWTLSFGMMDQWT